jgi:superfamily I DNA/RNA helicase
MPQRFNEIPSMASKPITVTGTSSFLKLKYNVILCRTNGTAISEIITAIDEGLKPHLVGNIDDLKQLVQGVQHLQAGEPSTASELAGFANWTELVEFVNSGEGEHLKTFVGLVQNRGPKQLLWALGRVVEQADADISISTAHKAKGLEWNNIKIADDFYVDKKLKGATFDEEMRLFYVAITRAKNNVDVDDKVLKLYTE